MQKFKELFESNENVQVGDIFYSDWGYDQSNIDFYQVTGKRGKSTVEIRQIGSKSVGQKGGYDKLVPVPNQFIGPVLKKRIDKSGWIKIEDGIFASKFDKPYVLGTSLGMGR